NNDGSRTPAWGSVPITTPAAETPHFYAATPAAETPTFNPPTPAVVETPGTYFAPTPGNTATNLIPATPAPVVYTPAPVTPGPGPLTPNNNVEQLNSDNVNADSKLFLFFKKKKCCWQYMTN